MNMFNQYNAALINIVLRLSIFYMK
jgi:hypothetical protein